MNESLESPLVIGQNSSLYELAAAIPLVNSTVSGIVSDEVRDIFTIINFAVLCGIFVIFGTTTNVINIIVFVKSGFKETVNISFLTLAISDLGCCFSLVLIVLCYNPLFQKLDLPFDPVDFHYLTSGWIHTAFTRITSCITAFITFERCLCVACPLKVKGIITPKRVTIFLVCIIGFITACISPVFITSRYVWKFDVDRNKSIIVLVFQKYVTKLNDVTTAIHSVFVPIAAFLVVVISTIVLVVSLRQKIKWRENAKTKSSNQQLSARDTRVSQMVVMIASLFIVCYLPVMVSFITELSLPGFNYKGQYKNVLLVMFSFHFCLEALNSSLNIFIYYRMSTSYRTIFLKLFGVTTKETPNTTKDPSLTLPREEAVTG